MRYVVALVAVLLISISALGIVVPQRLMGTVSAWPPDTSLYVAAGARLVIGVLFIAGARDCRFPGVIYAIGVLALAAAIVLILLGGARVDAMIAWWARLPPSFIRVTCLFGALVGMLVLFSAIPRSRPERPA